VLNRLELRDESGFTLIELLAACLLIGVVFAAFAGLFTSVEQRDTTLQQQAVLASTARPMLDSMAAELESAQCNGTTQPVTSASGTQLTFTTPDRQQPYHLQQITYSLSGGVFTRKVATSTNTGGPPWTMGSTVTTGTVTSVTNSVVFDFISSSGTDLSPNGAAVSAANLPTIDHATMTLVVAPTASHGSGSLTTQAAASLRTPTCN
jgi:prepilin-type N-terminal cleavage/methylation domain-containing protein